MSATLSFCLAGTAFGEQVSKVFQLEKFSAIATKGAVDIVIKQGTKQKIEITADKEVMENTEVKVVNQTLKVSRKGKGLFGFSDRCSGNCGIKIDLTVIDLKKIDAKGATEIVGKKLDLKELEIEISGAAEIALQGKSKSFEIDASGSAEVRAFDFVVEHAEVEVSGSGEIEIHATKSLRSEVKGSGEITYKGNPAEVKSNVAGSGEIKAYKKI